MGKLGYQWYPKDWIYSDSVFELNLSERGLYRELIDMAMLNDNKQKYSPKIWCRKFNCELKELQDILTKLMDLNLIEIKDDILFIESCESRLNLSRGGKKGGMKSTKNKPTAKPTPKPMVEPTHNQKKYKVNIKEKEKEIIVNNSVFVQECKKVSYWKEKMGMDYKINLNVIDVYLDDFDSHLIRYDEQKDSLKEFKSHFNNWLGKQDLSVHRNKRPTGKTNQVNYN